MYDRWVITDLGRGLCCKNRISADEIFCVSGAGRAEQIHTKIRRNHVQNQSLWLPWHQGSTYLENVAAGVEQMCR